MLTYIHAGSCFSFVLLQGENAWIFAAEDQVAGCVKAFIDFEKALRDEQPRDKRGKVKPTDITGAKCCSVNAMQFLSV